MAPTTQQAVHVDHFADGSHDLRAFVSVGEAHVIPPAAGEVLVNLILRPVNPAGEAARACYRLLQSRLVWFSTLSTQRLLSVCVWYRLLPHKWKCWTRSCVPIHTRHRRCTRRPHCPLLRHQNCSRLLHGCTSLFWTTLFGDGLS